MQIIIITLSCYNINSQSVAVMLLIKKVFNISSISVIRVITMSCGCQLVNCRLHNRRRTYFYSMFLMFLLKYKNMFCDFCSKTLQQCGLRVEYVTIGDHTTPKSAIVKAAVALSVAPPLDYETPNHGTAAWRWTTIFVIRAPAVIIAEAPGALKLFMSALRPTQNHGLHDCQQVLIVDTKHA